MVIASEVYVLSLVPAVLWGFEPVLSKRGMAAGASALRASLIVVVIDAVVYWTALFVRDGQRVLADVAPDAAVIFLFAGLVGTGVGRVATFTGVHRVGASVNSAAISTRPLFAVALAFVWLREPITIPTAVGIALLVGGLIVLTTSRGGDLRGWRQRDLLFPLLAALAFALGNVVRRFGLTTTDMTALQAVAFNETAALVALAGYALVGGRRDAFAPPRRSDAYFVGSGILTAIALVSLFAALGHKDGVVAVVDPLTGTAPLFTTVFAYFLLDDLERVTRGVVLGAVLIVAGAVLVTGF